MRLVVDTNRLFAAFVKDSVSRRILLSPRLHLFTPRFGKAELSRHLPEVLGKAGISEGRFYELSSLLFLRVSLVEDGIIAPFMPAAKAAMDSIDPGDTPFVAACLALNADGVWSDDRHFSRQAVVRVFKTRDLVGFV